MTEKVSWMTLATHYGNSFLDAFARQVNALEDAPGATQSYDKALEDEFTAIKQQELGNGAADASGSGRPTSSNGSRPPDGSAPVEGDTPPGDATGPSPSASITPTPAPFERVSIDQIASTAGSDAAASVKQIADGAAATVGSSAGPAIADTVAQASAQAAQHVIDTGGSTADAGLAATSVARAVAKMGTTAGQTAAANLSHLAVELSPATIQHIANTAEQAAIAGGGGAIGAAIANAATSAAASATNIAAAGGAATDAIETAARNTAQAVSDAVSSVPPANALSVAGTVADAAAVGGEKAATSVAEAAKAGGLEAAEVVAAGAKNAFRFAGGVIRGTAVNVGASAAAAETAGVTANVINLAIGLKMQPADAISAGQLVANAAAKGGNNLAGAVAPVINMVTLSHGALDDMTKFAGNVTAAFDAHGIDAATAVSNTTALAFEGVVNTSTSLPSSAQSTDLPALTKLNTDMSSIAVSDGASAAQQVQTLIKAVESGGGDLNNMQQATETVSSAYTTGGQASADAVATAITNASGQNKEFMNDVISLMHDAASGGASPDLLTKLNKNLTETLDEFGQTAADTVSDLVNNASKTSVPLFLNVADAISDAGTLGDEGLIQNVAQTVTSVATHGGDAQDIDVAGTAVMKAFVRGGSISADATTRVGELAVNLGATGHLINEVVATFSTRVQLDALRFGQEAAKTNATASLASLEEIASGPRATIVDLILGL